MSNINDFIIEDGLLKKYIGEDEIVVIPNGVTHIHHGAFYKNTTVTNVIIPDSVINIGMQAFDGCTRLKEIRIPKNVDYICDSSFRLCSAVEEIYVAEGNQNYYNRDNCLITKGGTLLRGCKNSIIPNDGSICFVGEDAFSGVLGLEKIFVPDSVSCVAEGAFFACEDLKEVRLPEGITWICKNTFAWCKKLTTINIPSTVTRIDNMAFDNCESLQGIVFPKCLQAIGLMAFSHCFSLTEIVIPDKVEKIEDSAFKLCESVISVSIGANVKQFGEEVFSFCPSIREIVVSDNNSSYFSSGNCIVHAASGEIVVGCSYSTIVPDARITGIRKKAFCFCNGMHRITIPSTIKHIEKDAFFGCEDLKEITIEEQSLTYNGSIYESLLESMESIPRTKIVARYSIVKCAPESLVEDKGIFGKLKAARKDLVQYAIERNDAATVERLFSLFPSTDRVELDRYLQLPNIASDIAAFLQKYAETHCAKKTAAKSGKGPSVAELKALFSFKDIDGGLLAMGYKGTESEITIPSIVGKKRVLGVSKLFNSNAKWDASHITLSDGIEFIEDGAFAYCRNLQSVSLPSSIREIKENAFDGCSQLTSITLPSGCIVRWAAFRECVNLSEVKFPEDVQLENAVFWKCSNLADHDGFTVIRTILYDYSGDSNSIVIPDRVTAISSRAFWQNNTIVKVDMSDHIESIGNEVFYGCQKLEEVHLSVGITRISRGMFENCCSLENVIIPGSVKEIDDAAFADCFKIRNITIPDGVKKLGQKVFSCCSKLQEVHLPASITFIGKEAFHRYGKPLPFVTIYAPAGSYAEKYAKKNKLSFVAE